MCDHIPFEIQTEIIKILPIKALIRIRSVSKRWKSLIDSSEFMADYHVRHAQPHLLVMHTHSNNYYTRDFISLVDDDTLPRQNSDLTVPLSIKRLGKTRMIQSSDQGLICFYKFDGVRGESGTAVLWNPCIRKSVVIDLPNMLDNPYQNTYETFFGFGVCRNTTNPKLVTISYLRSPVSSVPWKVKVFTLSTRVWKCIFINLPHNSIALSHEDRVVKDGVMYWLAFNRLEMLDHRDIHILLPRNTRRSYNRVISFDLTTEEFTEIYFPDKLAAQSKTLLIYKPTKSLAVVGINWEVGRLDCDIWIMEEHGARKSFTKLYRAAPTYLEIGLPILEFRKNGEAIIQTRHYSNQSDSKLMIRLVSYEPFSEHIHDLGICKDSAGSFSVTSYTESLLLLDHPDSVFR